MRNIEVYVRLENLTEIKIPNNYSINAKIAKFSYAIVKYFTDIFVSTL